jgi:hypothetical protein
MASAVINSPTIFERNPNGVSRDLYWALRLSGYFGTPTYNSGQPKEKFVCIYIIDQGHQHEFQVFIVAFFDVVFQLFQILPGCQRLTAAGIHQQIPPPGIFISKEFDKVTVQFCIAFVNNYLALEFPL